MSRRAAATRAALALAALLAWPHSATAFGFAAHRLAHEKAIGTLPPPLRELFAGNAAYLREHAVDPDLWAISGVPGEQPNHYLDMDAFGAYPFAEIPLSEAEHQARHGKKASSEGRVPWRVGEVYRELVAAFRAGDAARVLERAAVLGHYVADAYVPLHSLVNYDGQLTDQKGVHGRWETVMFARFERQIEPRVLPAAAERVEDPVAAVFLVLRESFAEAQETLAADREVAGTLDLAETPEDDRYDDGYYSRLFEREEERFVARLTSAAHLVGSLWYSAWDEAGRPAVDSSFRFPYVRRQTRMILATLDGAGSAAVADAMARGLMPNLAGARRRGAWARGLAPAGAASSAQTLVTGSDEAGAEPIWVTGARQGLDVTTVCVPETWPFAPYLREKSFGADFGRSLSLIGDRGGPVIEAAVFSRLPLRPAEGWKGPLPSGADLRELALRVGGVAVDGLLFDDPGDSVSGFDTLLLAVGKDAAHAIRLKPRPAGDTTDGFQALTVPLAGGPSAVSFRLFAVAPDGSDLLLYQAPFSPLETSRERVRSAALQSIGGFVGGGAADAYRSGALGRTLPSGGDGTAEARYVETIRLAARQLGRLTEFAARRTRADLLIAHLPNPAEALGIWSDLLEPKRAGYDGALAARLRPHVDALFRIVDGCVGTLAELAGEDATLAIVGPEGPFVVTGPGVAAGADLGLVRARDVAPTLSALLGIDPPARARGAVAPAALARSLPARPSTAPSPPTR